MKKFLVLVILILASLGFHPHVFSKDTDPYMLPVKPGTSFYLTGTPETHSIDGSDASIDIQLIDSDGFVYRGAPLYAPMAGTARYGKTENSSGVIIIRSNDELYEIVVAHVLDDVHFSQEILETYPKRVKRGELIGYQGNSGYIGTVRLPTHVHFSVFKKEKDEYKNNDNDIKLCENLNIKEYCEIANATGNVVFINESI